MTPLNKGVKLLLNGIRTMRTRDRTMVRAERYMQATLDGRLVAVDQPQKRKSYTRQCKMEVISALLAQAQLLPSTKIYALAQPQ